MKMSNKWEQRPWFEQNGKVLCNNNDNDDDDDHADNANAENSGG